MDSVDMNLGKLLEMVRDREAWRSTVHGVVKSWTRLSDFHSLTHSVKAMVFSVVMYGCESSTIKKAEH